MFADLTEEPSLPPCLAGGALLQLQELWEGVRGVAVEGLKMPPRASCPCLSQCCWQLVLLPACPHPSALYEVS